MTNDSNISRRRKSALRDGKEEYAAKRAELVEIAARLFREKGYQATRLADIAAAAGLDRASVYYYVGSKEELFRTSVEGILDQNLQSAAEIEARSDIGVADKVRQIFAVLMRSYEESFPHMYVYIQEQMHQVAKDDSAWSQEMLRKTRRFEALVIELLNRGIENKELRGDIPVRLLSNALFGMFNWTHRWYVPGRALSCDKVADAFVSIFLDGVVADRSE
ncbi:TetR/AcrR family transcriptional regulator [Sphingomonas sp. C8-2]|jgi:AcrR family transcriptional regulator|nr:TetR/AcrR family transcriptional regulator [Sphingomonas sp. C8-2]